MPNMNKLDEILSRFFFDNKSHTYPERSMEARSAIVKIVREMLPDKMIMPDETLINEGAMQDWINKANQVDGFNQCLDTIESKLKELEA